MTRISAKSLGGAAAALAVGGLGAQALLAGPPSPPGPGPAGRFPAPAAGKSATVWAVGDGADGSEAARSVARLIGVGRPARLLYLGDVYDSGSASEFRDNYATVYGTLKRSTAPTPGNHDWPAHREGYDRYWRSVTGRRPPDHYSFRLAGWQILSLNSEGPLDDNSAHQKWLRRRLSTPGSCRIAFLAPTPLQRRQPRRSAGRRADLERHGRKRATGAQRPRPQHAADASA